jgi:hypothetical protein
LSQKLRTLPLPGAHVLVGYQWQNIGLRPDLISSRNTSEHDFVSQPPKNLHVTVSRHAAQAFQTPFAGRGNAVAFPCTAFTIRTWSRCRLTLEGRTSSLAHLCRHLLCLLYRFTKFSREERPDGSLPAFAWSPVATPIRLITRRLSLFPSSPPCHPISSPYGRLSFVGG